MDLGSELARGRDDDGGDMVFLGRLAKSQQLLDQGDQESKSLPTSRDCL